MKWMSLLFHMLSRLVITFLPRRKCLSISWLQSPSAVILEPRKIKSATVSTVSPFICHEVMGLDAMILVFWMLSFKSAFHSLLSPSSRGSLVPLHFLPLGWCHLHIWGDWYFSRQSWFQLVLLPALGCYFLLQGIFPSQGSNLGLLHCKWVLYRWTPGEALRRKITKIKC